MKNVLFLLLPAMAAALGCSRPTTGTVASAAAPASEFSAGTIQIGVVVSDLERSLDFYQNVIGMTRTGGFSIDQDFGRRSGLSGGQPFDVAVLKLQDSPSAAEWKLMSFGKEAQPRSQYIQEGLGMRYITLFVHSVKPVLERLRAAGVPLLGETPVKLPNGQTFILVQDPDGIFVELIGPA